jgi:hypothetical protein
VSKLILVAVLTAVLAMPAGGAVAQTWRVIGSGQASGSAAVASARGDVRSPIKLRLRTTGSYTGGTVTVVHSCRRTLRMGPGGTREITIRGSYSCNVIASARIDKGKITLKLEAYR